MRIQVTSIGDIVEKQSSKPNKFGKLSKYQQVEVQYLSNGRAGKRQIMSFNPNGVYDSLLAAQEGQEFEITTKQDGEYPNWDTATPVSASDESKAKQSIAAEGKPAKGATAFKSTYETPEERAKKQVYIVRQSSLSNAIAMYAATDQKNIDEGDIVATAREFEAYVFDNVDLDNDKELDDPEVD